MEEEIKALREEVRSFREEVAVLQTTIRGFESRLNRAGIRPYIPGKQPAYKPPQQFPFFSDGLGPK